MKRKYFIIKELLFPFIYTTGCIGLALLGHYLPEGNGKSDMAVAIFSIFGFFSIFIWVFHIRYALNPDSYYRYLKECYEKKKLDEIAYQKIEELKKNQLK